MEAALKYIEELDLDNSRTPSKETKEKIRDLIRQAIEQESSNLHNAPVPVKVLRYAIYNVIFPEIKFGLTKPLLDLLTSLELHRKCHLEILDDLFPSLMDEGYLPQVSQELTETLMEQKKFDSDMRDIFLRIVETACACHVYETWINGSATDFWILFNYYFASFSEADAPRSTFYSDISPAEVERVNSAAKECLEAISNGYTVALDIQSTAEKPSISDILKSEEFSNSYVPVFVTKASTLQGLIKAYVDTIFNDAEAIAQVMPK